MPRVCETEYLDVKGHAVHYDEYTVVVEENGPLVEVLKQDEERIIGLDVTINQIPELSRESVQDSVAQFKQRQANSSTNS